MSRTQRAGLLFTSLSFVAALSVQSAHAQLAIPAGPGPASPEAARLLAAGLDKLCIGFLSHPVITPNALQALAAKAGYLTGADDPYGPVGKPVPNAPPAIGFHGSIAKDKNAASIVVYVTPAPVTCQLRVKGDAAAWSGYLANMSLHEGRLLASAELGPDTKFSHEVYTGGIPGLPHGFTTFVNRWVGQGAPSNETYTIINVLPDSGGGS